MPKLHVICHRPGMHRGGRTNPKHAAYDLGDHSPEELAALRAEPEITLIVGDLLTDEHAAEGAKAHKAAKKSA